MAVGRAIPAMLCMTESDSTRAMLLLENDATFNPSMIFLDLNMPVLDGRECLRRIRQVGRLAHTPVYIFSTSNNGKEVQVARMLGSSGYIVKPNSFDKLVEALMGVMESKGSDEFYLFGEISG